MDHVVRLFKVHITDCVYPSGLTITLDPFAFSQTFAKPIVSKLVMPLPSSQDEVHVHVFHDLYHEGHEDFNLVKGVKCVLCLIEDHRYNDTSDSSE